MNRPEALCLLIFLIIIMFSILNFYFASDMFTIYLVSKTFNPTVLFVHLTISSIQLAFHSSAHLHPKSSKTLGPMLSSTAVNSYHIM